MKEFNKKELKKSLFDGVSLMSDSLDPKKETKYVWASFDEIPIYIKDGLILFNDQKREYFKKLTEHKNNK